MTMIHFKVIPGLAVAWRQLPGDGPVLLPAASVRRGLVDGGGHGLLSVPELAINVSFPDDRQASDRSPTDAMAVPASSYGGFWTKDCVPATSRPPAQV